MKRRSFLAMLGLAPVAAKLPEIEKLLDEPPGSIPVIDYDILRKAMREQNRKFQVAVYDKLRSRDGKLEMTKDGEIKMFI